MSLEWSYGITTVPERRDVLLPRTIKSLAGAGFDRPHLFVDGCEDPDSYQEFNLNYTCRTKRLRTFGNWIASMWELFAKSPHADRYAIFQDDLVISKGVKEYLDECDFPERGYLNLLTFRENHKLVGKKPVGWHKSNQRGMGAVALVFNWQSLHVLLSCSHMTRWALNKDNGHRLVDRAISQSMKKRKITEFVHNPSLIQHTGIQSSMGSDRHPLSTCFRGEDFFATGFSTKSVFPPIEKRDLVISKRDAPLHPVRSSKVKFSVGVIASSPNEEIVTRCVKSVLQAGFGDVTVFAVPGCSPGECESWNGVNVVRRPDTLAPILKGVDPKELGSPWQNSVQAMADLIKVGKSEGAIVIIEDDVTLCRGVEQFLSADLWPTGKTGLVSIHSHGKRESIEGCTLSDDYQLSGMKATVWPMAVAKKAINLALTQSWPHRSAYGESSYGKWAGRAISKIEKDVHFYTPSLCQSSSLQSSSFIPEDEYVQDFYETRDLWPFVRFNMSGTRRYAKVKRKPVVRVSIPAVDSADLTINCLKHLSLSDWPLIVDYVDNGSAVGVMEQIQKAGQSFGLRMECERFEENQGFTPAVNISMQKALDNGHYCLILNNDCMVAPETIERLFRAMLADENIAVAGPLSTDNSVHSLRNKKRLLQSGLKSLPSHPDRPGEVIATLRDTTPLPIKRLAFFCCLISPEAIKKVGLLPAEFQDGLGADDAWCHLARKAGMTCNIILDSYAYHMHHETFKRLGIDRRKASSVAVSKLKRY